MGIQFCRNRKPVYQSLGGNASLSWKGKEKNTFPKVKEDLMSAPVLRLPNITKPFQLFVDEQHKVVKGILFKLWDTGEGLWPICLNA